MGWQLGWTGRRALYNPSPIIILPVWVSIQHYGVIQQLLKLLQSTLHWLRIPERISFKLAVLTYRAIHGAWPSYFQSCFTRVADMPSRRRLRSSGSDRLHVPIIRRSTVGSRTFTASCAAVWNDLPAHVTAAPSLAVFRQRLKTFLFSRSYPDIVS